MQLIHVVEAVRRIPQAFKVTFFGADDIWHFFAVMDDVVCPECEAYDGHELRGNRIRGLFPYLDVVDVDTIKAEAGYGLVHPNCRCYMKRMPKLGSLIRVRDYGPILDDRHEEQ